MIFRTGFLQDAIGANVLPADGAILDFGMINASPDMPPALRHDDFSPRKNSRQGVVDVHLFRLGLGVFTGGTGFVQLFAQMPLTPAPSDRMAISISMLAVPDFDSHNLQLIELRGFNTNAILDPGRRIPVSKGDLEEKNHGCSLDARFRFAFRSTTANHQ